MASEDSAAKKTGLDPAELPIVIRRAWDAIVPPILELCATFALVAYLLAPSTLQQVFQIPAPADLLPSKDVRELVSYYGLSTLLPIATVMGLILLSNLHSRFVRAAGELIPGRLVPNTTFLFLLAADDSMLRQIWALHPGQHGANGVNTMNIVIDEAIVRANDGADGHHRLKYLQKYRTRLHRFTNRISFARGLVVVAIATWMCAPQLIEATKRPTQQLCAVLAVLVLWITINALWRISGELAFARNKIQSYLAMKSSLTGDGGEPKIENYSRDEKLIADLRKIDAQGNAWQFCLFPPRPKFRADWQLGRALLRFRIRP
jgi:hypothetical protein